RGRDLVEAVELRLDGDAVLDVLDDGLGLVELGLLHEDADAEARRELRLAVGGGVETRHDLEDRGLARTVRADHADPGSRQERHRHVVEDELVAHLLAGAYHGVDVFGHAYDPRLARAAALPRSAGAGMVAGWRSRCDRRRSSRMSRPWSDRSGRTR